MSMLNGEISFWIRAFIPRDVPGVTKTIPTGKHRGQTAISLPLAALLHPYNAFDFDRSPSLGNFPGYLTDQRGFSDQVTQSARMISMARVRLYPAVMLAESHLTFGTTEVDLRSGVVRGHADADMSKCTITGPYGAGSSEQSKDTFEEIQRALLGAIRTGPPNGRDETRKVNHFFRSFHTSTRLLHVPKPDTSFAVRWNVHGEASDPLVAGAANIDYDLDYYVVLDRSKSRVFVGVFGNVDSFPAFESYVSFNGVKKALFQIPPPPGNTPFNLIDGPGEGVAFAVSFP